MSKEARQSSPFKLHGKVLAFNINPKGHIGGALVETSTGTAQINFAKHEAETLARSMNVGEAFDLEVQIESDGGDHIVYRTCDEAVEASGTIVRLNYDHDGKVNGYHLEDGTFVHVTHEGAKKYQLHIGEAVKATGSRHAGTDAVVLEATSIVR